MSGQARREFFVLIGSRLRVLANILVDALFMGLWLGVLGVFDEVTAGLQNSGDIEWATAKIILGAATLLLIVMYLYWDLRAANLLLHRRFEEERVAVTVQAPRVVDLREPAPGAPGERG